MKVKTIHIHDVELQLLPEKVLYLPAFKTLCIADWHLGKAAHFRKAGIPIPQPDLSLEFGKVSALIAWHGAERVVLLGDVFHSKMNNDWFLFRSFIETHPRVEWVLTIGNHDIIAKDEFEAIGVNAVTDYVLGSVYCSHEPLEDLPENALNVVGHVHPGCEIRLGARQKFRLPCFYYRNGVLTLPAFGGLTGLYIVRNDEGRVFAIAGDEVKELKGKL